MNNTPLSLYIHFPWCVRKCPYCDFNSHEAVGDIPEAQYVKTLVTDLEAELELDDRRALTSIFMGGGTPSLFSPRAISDLLSSIRSYFHFDDIEITMEANPGTFDQENFCGYREAGVNRISIGAQSFSASYLQSLGRIHNPGDILTSFRGAREAGFERINLDLMHGLPGQSVDHALEDLQSAVELAPEHISWYQLTIEPNTVFYRYPPVLPPEAELENIQESGASLLQGAGFRQYEVSAYARSGQASIHNMNYWQFGDYIGLGAGAHGKITHGNGITRTTKSRVPKDYLNNPIGKRIEVPACETNLEFLMNALRLNTGFTYDLFEVRTGNSREDLKPFVRRALSKGLIEQGVEDGITPTPLGRQFLNDLLVLAD